MPNETPKSKCCNAAIFHDHQIGGWKCTNCLMLVVPPNQCTCGLHPHAQANCPAAKQPDEMPDVIYAYPAVTWYNTEDKNTTPYIRKSIHDKAISFANDIIAKRDNEITKLKSKLKECVETLTYYADKNIYIVGEYGYNLVSPIELDKGSKAISAITSAKGLYE